MQMNNVGNNLYLPQNLKCVEKKNKTQYVHEKNFRSGLQNARRILSGLERSVRKSSKYERQLLRCRATHTHSHDEWPSDTSERLSNSRAGTMKSMRSQVDVGESWSTMSIVCLQYQYEELTKRFETLLQLYDDGCSAVNARDRALARLRMRARRMQARLASVHKTLLAVGDKYVALRGRKIEQKHEYEEKLKQLQDTVRDILEAADRARLRFDAQVTRSLAVERDSSTALLLAEIRKCHVLCLENLRLKAQIEQKTSGNAADVWEQ